MGIYFCKNMSLCQILVSCKSVFTSRWNQKNIWGFSVIQFASCHKSVGSCSWKNLHLTWICECTEHHGPLVRYLLGALPSILTPNPAAMSNQRVTDIPSLQDKFKKYRYTPLWNTSPWSLPHLRIPGGLNWYTKSETICAPINLRDSKQLVYDRSYCNRWRWGNNSQTYRQSYGECSDSEAFKIPICLNPLKWHEMLSTRCLHKIHVQNDSFNRPESTSISHHWSL